MTTTDVDGKPLRNDAAPDAAQQRFAAALAVLGWAALIAQAFISVNRHIALGNGAAYGVMMYTGYFTILTNAFCALVATSLALGPQASANWRWWRAPDKITAAAVSILLVGVVYHLLLRAIHHPTGLEYACNIALHYLVPPLFVLLWWIVVPRGALLWRDAGVAFAFPAAYAVYVFARGEMAGVYPYPFFDVLKIGYPAAVRNAAGLSIAFIFVGLAFVALKRGAVSDR